MTITLRDQFAVELSAIPMSSIIEWYQWEDRNGEFDDLTFDGAVDIAVYWFESLDDMAAGRYAFLGADLD